MGLNAPTDHARARPAAASIGLTLWPGIAALIAVMGIARFAYTPILPDMLSAGVLSMTDAGWVASANFMGYLIGALVATAVRDRRLQDRLLWVGLAGSALLLAAMAWSDALAGWMLLRLCAGIASAFSLIFISNRVFERMAAMGASDRTVGMFSGVAIGIIISALVCLGATWIGGAWTTQWWLMAVCSAVFGWLAWDGLKRLERRAHVTTAEQPLLAPTPAASPQAPKAFAAAVLAYGCFGFGYVIHATFLPAMIRAAGFSADFANLGWILVGGVALPAIVFWRWLAGRVGARAALTACYACEGLSALAPLAGDSLAPALIASIGLGAGFIPLTGMALPFARSLDASRAGQAVALMTVAFGVGQIAGPLLAAYLAQGGGFAVPSMLSSAALLLGALLMAPRLDAQR
jgi:predicted MFS family arabinose efflux permease